MIIRHHDLKQDLDDEWWDEAGMQGFKPDAHSYHVDVTEAKGRPIEMVDVQEVAPFFRNLSHGIFNDNKQTEQTARERVVAILQGFVRGDAIPPVEVVRLPEGNAHRYKLTHGAHRFYLSIAAGFSHVPTVAGFDYENWKD